MTFLNISTLAGVSQKLVYVNTESQTIKVSLDLTLDSIFDPSILNLLLKWTRWWCYRPCSPTGSLDGFD